MRVTRLSLTNFRSYAQVDIDFDDGVTTLVGRNGQGKTNIVEAVRYLSVLSSHRVAADVPMIHVGEDAATIRAAVEKAGRALTLEITINRGKSNAARMNRAAVRPRDIVGILRSVVFAPEDLSLVKGEPTDRRRFLDEVCVALAPTLAGDLSDYDRVVRQRATLLKTARGKSADLSTLDVWDEKLVSLGSRITAARATAIAALAPYVAAAYADIAPESNACMIRYESPIRLAAAKDHGTTLQTLEFDLADVDAVAATFTAALAAVRPKELDRGVCLIGPHRDDLTIDLGELPAKGYASHGESWSCALALRLGTYDLLTADGGPDADPDGEPVLILDDVFAELDVGRRAALARRARAAHQVIVTAAVAEDVPVELDATVLYIADGEVTST